MTVNAAAGPRAARPTPPTAEPSSSEPLTNVAAEMVATGNHRISNAQALELVAKAEGDVGALKAVKEQYQTRFTGKAERTFDAELHKLEHPIKSAVRESAKGIGRELKPFVAQVLKDAGAAAEEGRSPTSALDAAVESFLNSPARATVLQQAVPSLVAMARKVNPKAADIAAATLPLAIEKRTGEALMAGAEVVSPYGPALMYSALTGLEQGGASRAVAEVAATSAKIAAFVGTAAAEAGRIGGGLAKAASALGKALPFIGEGAKLMQLGTAIADVVRTARDAEASGAERRASGLYLVGTLIGLVPGFELVGAASQFAREGFRNKAGAADEAGAAADLAPTFSDASADPTASTPLEGGPAGDTAVEFLEANPNPDAGTPVAGGPVGEAEPTFLEARPNPDAGTPIARSGETEVAFLEASPNPDAARPVAANGPVSPSVAAPFREDSSGRVEW